MVAWKDWSAPSLTEAETGESKTAMSLDTVTPAVEDLDESVWLVAVTWTFPPEGRSAGAVNSPSGEMVPTCGEPPAMPLTLQKTDMSEVLVTVAEKGSVLPSNTVPELGAMVMVICGGGGGVVEPPGPLEQAVMETPRPRRKIVRAVRQRTRGLRVEKPCFERDCQRGRMEFAIADEGPAKERDDFDVASASFARVCIY